jgi:hypothetical protein
VDHKSDDTAISDNHGTFTHNGKEQMRKTMKGWYLCVQWKDGTTTWEWFTNIKESYPVEATEYARAHDIHTKPAFA